MDGDICKHSECGNDNYYIGYLLFFILSWFESSLN